MAELGKAYVSIVPKLQGNFSGVMTREMDAAGAKSGKIFGSKFSGTAKKAVVAGIAGVAAAGAAATSAVIGLANSTADYGDNVDKMSQKLGISSTAFQEWEAVLQHSGTSMESMAPSFKKLATQAQGGGDKTEAAFKKIGISMKDAQSMSQEDLWAATIKGLQGMEEGSERTAVASQLLGRGATELGALLNTSSEDTQKMIDRVNELGGVLSEDSIKQSAAFKDALQDLQTALSAIGHAIGASLLPLITDLMEGFTNIASGNPAEGINQIKEAFENLLPEGLRDQFDNIVTVVSENLQPAFDDAKTTFEDLSEQFGTFVEENGPAITDMFGAISEAVSASMSAIMEVIRTVSPVVGPIVSELVREITIKFKALSAIVSTVRSIFNTVKEAISHPMETAKTLVKTAMETIKGVFNTTLKFPHINIPHISVSGGTAPWGMGGKGTPPNFSIDYYAKGGIITNAAVIGEAGAEAIVPYTNSNIRPWARALADELNGGTTINLYYDASADANQMVLDIAAGLKRINAMGVA